MPAVVGQPTGPGVPGQPTPGTAPAAAQPAKPQLVVKVFRLERGDPEVVIQSLHSPLEAPNAEAFPPAAPGGFGGAPPGGMFGFGGMPAQPGGAIGFGGVFAVYTYLASTLMHVTHAPAGAVPFVFAIFGIGMTLGNLIVPRYADRALMPTAGVALAWFAVTLALYPFAAGNLIAISVVLFCVGLGCALAVILQTRLMDVAGDAQALAAALNHSAFNFANALGPLLGGMAISAGYGWTSTGWVGCGLALVGLLVWWISWRTSQQ